MKTSCTDSSSGLRAAGFTMAIVALVILSANMVSLVLTKITTPTGIPTFLVATVSQQFLFMSVIPLAMYLQPEEWQDTFQLQLPSIKKGLAWAAIFLVYIGVLNGTLMLLERNQAIEAMLKYWNQCTGIYTLIFIVGVVVLAPLGEEIIFRGYLFGGISRSSAGPITGALVSTVIWALLHTQYYIPNPLVPELVGLFIMGLALCAVRYKTRSLWLAILLHMVNNLIGMLSLWVES